MPYSMRLIPTRELNPLERYMYKENTTSSQSVVRIVGPFIVTGHTHTEVGWVKDFLGLLYR